MTKTFLEKADVAKMIEAATNRRDQILIHLLFHLGCRISEALALEVQNIDLENATATIQQLKSRVELACPSCHARVGKYHMYCPKCGRFIQETQAKALEHRRYRTLPIDDKTLDMLRDFISRGGPVERKGKNLLFGINRHRAWQIIKGCAEQAGLPKLMNSESGKLHFVSPHRLRDGFAINAIGHDDSGTGLRALQLHLGHASFNTTAEYVKRSGEQQRAWYNQLWGKDDGHGSS